MSISGWPALISVLVGSGLLGGAWFTGESSHEASARQASILRAPFTTMPTDQSIATPTMAPWPAPPALTPLPWAVAPRRTSNAIAPAVEAHAAVVIDEASGTILFEKDAHRALPPASLTKITTAILAIKRLDLSQWVAVDVNSHKMLGSSVMGLRPGDRFRVRDLLYGLMLPSGNDAALALARAVSGSEAAFVLEMNAFVARLGLRDVHFVNPHGLSGPSQVASAYDLAILSRYGMALPAFARIVSTADVRTGGPRVLRLSNSNTFLLKYEGADGVKIGHTLSAGPTLAASATRDGHRLYAVVLNSEHRDADAMALLDWAFAAFSWPASYGHGQSRSGRRRIMSTGRRSPFDVASRSSHGRVRRRGVAPLSPEARAEPADPHPPGKAVQTVMRPRSNSSTAGLRLKSGVGRGNGG
jgi:D-alanyl-D-alanine carboxypeptidase (penicillin-binding protein 5/6)